MREVPASPAPTPATTEVPWQQPLPSPASLKTPTNTIGFAALQRKLEERLQHADAPDLYLQKMLNAAQQAFAERKLLRVENKTLIQQNNEKNGT